MNKYKISSHLKHFGKRFWMAGNFVFRTFWETLVLVSRTLICVKGKPVFTNKKVDDVNVQHCASQEPKYRICSF